MPARHIVVVAQVKGGGGKTATAAALASAWAHSGHTVITWDLDAGQCNLTQNLGIHPTGNHDLGAALERRHSGDDTSRITDALTDVTDNWRHAAADTVSMRSADQAIGANPGEGLFRLRELLDATDDHDISVVDTAGDLGILTSSAVTAADWVIVPVGPSKNHLTGARSICATVSNMARHHTGLQLGGIITTSVDKVSRNSADIVTAAADLAAAYNTTVLQPGIPTDTKVREAEIAGIDIVRYAPLSRAAIAYRDLAAAILTQLERGDL
jgi:chromosome partitioning protein